MMNYIAFFIAFMRRLLGFLSVGRQDIETGFQQTPNLPAFDFSPVLIGPAVSEIRYNPSQEKTPQVDGKDIFTLIEEGAFKTATFPHTRTVGPISLTSNNNKKYPLHGLGITENRDQRNAAITIGFPVRQAAEDTQILKIADNENPHQGTTHNIDNSVLCYELGLYSPGMIEWECSLPFQGASPAANPPLFKDVAGIESPIVMHMEDSERDSLFEVEPPSAINSPSIALSPDPDGEDWATPARLEKITLSDSVLYSLGITNHEKLPQKPILVARPTATQAQSAVDSPVLMVINEFSSPLIDVEPPSGLSSPNITSSPFCGGLNDVLRACEEEIASSDSLQSIFEPILGEISSSSLHEPDTPTTATSMPAMEDLQQGSDEKEARLSQLIEAISTPSIAKLDEIDYGDDNDSASEYSCDSQAYAVCDGAPELMLTVPTPPTSHEPSGLIEVDTSLLYAHYRREKEDEDSEDDDYYYEDYYSEDNHYHYDYYSEDDGFEDDLDPLFLDTIINPMRSLYTHQDHELETIPEETTDELDAFNITMTDVSLALPTGTNNSTTPTLTASPASLALHVPSSATTNALSLLAARPFTCKGPKMPWGIKV